jgi:Zn-dependent M28 family amino/carboxypeptidase
MKPAFKTCFGLVLLLFALAAPASDAGRVMDEAMKPSPLEDNLRRLTDEVGGRIPGTPAMERAVRWGVEAFRAAGADSVTTESFPMPISWSEGATRVEVVSPSRFRVRAVSLAWAPPIAVARRARVVDVGEGSKEEFSKAGDIRGAVVLIHSETMKSWDDLFAEYMRAPGIISSALAGKAATIAFTSTRERDLLYRHTNASLGTLDKIPMVLVAREDGQRIARLVAAKQKVEVELYIPNQVGKAVAAANVVAELRGSERPDEYVVLGAHLDSWELGTGALDNGCNAALVIDALRAIKASGIKPRRSIRFVLFSGEEEGMIGSRAYVQKHRAEMEKIAGVVIFDEGSGRVSGFSLGGRKDIAGTLGEIIAPLGPWGANTLTSDAFWGTDNFDFLLEGVPTLVANQVEANYLENYHASSDTFDKVDLAELKKHVALAAEVTLGIANAPGRLGPRQSRGEIETLMKETTLDIQMQTLGLWPEWQSGKRGRAH